MKVTYKFYMAEGGFFGAYKVGSFNNGEPQLAFNMDAMLEVLEDEPEDSRLGVMKDLLAQTLVHEFAHSIQEFLDVEFDEYQVEKMMAAYNDKWGVFESEDSGGNFTESQVFKINDFLKWMEGNDAVNLSEFKDDVRSLFRAHTLWVEAEEKHKKEQEKLN